MSAQKKKIRTSFRESVFKRDGYKCRVCGHKGETAELHELDAHHITDRNDMPNGGYVVENGISLCQECHLKAEELIQLAKVWEMPNTHAEALYKMIGSSYEKAVAASKNL